MRALITPPQFMDPQDREICEEVCGALDEWAAAGDDRGALAYLAALRFGKKWYTTLLNVAPDSECRERLDRAVNLLARLDTAFVDEQGRLWDAGAIAANDGKVDTRTDRETGEVYRVLMFPYVDHAGDYVFQVARSPQ